MRCNRDNRTPHRPPPHGPLFPNPKGSFQRNTEKNINHTWYAHMYTQTNKKMKPYSATPRSTHLNAVMPIIASNFLSHTWHIKLLYTTISFWSPEGTSAIWLWLNVIIVLPSNWLVAVFCPWQNKRTRRTTLIVTDQPGCCPVNKKRLIICRNRHSCNNEMNKKKEIRCMENCFCRNRVL